ncbi:MAG: hypothetical protein AAF704_15845 [Cyanobacteria bacterium P01_D01_bin.123]
MRFAILKGACGFGDRLQCLLQAIHYAHTTGRHLVVDWRDPEWSHGESVEVEDYLHIGEVQTMRLGAFLTLFKASRGQLSVWPSPWNDRMTDPDFHAYIYKPEYNHDHSDIIRQIAAHESLDFHHDVVVLPGIGHRSYRFEDFRRVFLVGWITTQLKRFAAQQHLCRAHYDVVHLRGGSKVWAGGKVKLPEITAQIGARWPTRESYLNEIHNRYREVVSGSCSDLVLLTDSRQLGESWQHAFGCGRLLNDTFNTELSGSGIHQIEAQVLFMRGVDKRRINYEMIRDFVVMLNARHLVSDGVSLFSKVAGQARQADVQLYRLTGLP